MRIEDGFELCGLAREFVAELHAFKARGLRLGKALLQRNMAAELDHVVIRPADRIGADADHSALLEGREKGMPISCF
jgi:hypothetical protein